jgi:hypothetical protein
MSTTWLWLLGAVVILYLVKVAVVRIPRLMARRSRPELSVTISRLRDVMVRNDQQAFHLATITERPLATAFLALIVSVILVIGLTILFVGYERNFFENIMVEAHGMVLDILVIGLFILWLNKLGEKRLENKRYQDEIDDFRYWHSEEAAHRIVGSIKRLNKNGISNIDLSHCYLARMVLRRANLQGALLMGANLQGARLHRRRRSWPCVPPGIKGSRGRARCLCHPRSRKCSAPSTLVTL